MKREPEGASRFVEGALRFASELRPGDRLENGALFIAATPHPVFSGALLVVWIRENRLYLNALPPNMAIGRVVNLFEPQAERQQTLRNAVSAQRYWKAVGGAP